MQIFIIAVLVLFLFDIAVRKWAAKAYERIMKRARDASPDFYSAAGNNNSVSDWRSSGNARLMRTDDAVCREDDEEECEKTEYDDSWEDLFTGLTEDEINGILDEVLEKTEQRKE